MVEGEGKGSAGDSLERPVVYCLIPGDLASKLHDLLRHHFAGDPGVEVVVERRRCDRRGGADRRAAEAEPAGEERRRIHGAGGRRVAERRTVPAPVSEPPPLPRRARRYAERISFFERREPAGEEASERDAARLVTRFQAGDSEAYATIYTRYFERVFGYMRVALRDTHEAEDATQQVFLRVLENLGAYEHRSRPFRNWLFTIARNQALAELRRAGRVQLADQETLDRLREDEVEEAPELRELDWINDRDLLLFVERLPAVQRQVLALRYMMGLTHKEAAAVLGRTPDDIKAYHHRAVRFLRERLNAIGRGPEQPRRGRAGVSRVFQQAEVLRHRRFALH